MSTVKVQNGDWDGYGEGWEDLREQALERNRYTCQRCFRDNGALQAHHIVPRAESGPDSLDNLITLCRPCHAVQHPENYKFDDSRPDATLFPDPKAPECVTRMRHPRHHECERCQTPLEDPEQIIAYRPNRESQEKDEVFALCKPCAGVVVNQIGNAKHFLAAQQRVPLDELTHLAEEAPFYPESGADQKVFVRREAQNGWERMYEIVPLWGLVWRALAWICAIAIVLWLLLG